MAATGGMRATSTVVIGGGHSGLAMSKCLSDRSIDHVVLERGKVAQSWKTQRWDSLRLLTPNWQSRLPGHSYGGDEPDNFMTVAELVDFVEEYAAVIDAPVQTETTVTAVTPHPSGSGYVVETNQGPWRCQSVVLASGACNTASIPDAANGVPAHVDMVSPLEYRNPGQLADGGVMVVGASATGAQLAEEIHASGRPVTLSVGEHVRMPRTYRGKDIQHWMHLSGLLDERYDEVDDITRARKVASPQLVGTPQRTTLDLNALTDAGVELRGRVGMVRDGVAMFSGGLRNMCSLADLKMGRLLNTIDEWVTEAGLDAEVPEGERGERTRVPEAPPLTLDLNSGEIKTIVWATGFRPQNQWLDVPVFDHKGRIKHDGGIIVDAPGMYLLGATFLRRRKSSFIHGAGDDANDLAEHLAGFLSGEAAIAPSAAAN